MRELENKSNLNAHKLPTKIISSYPLSSYVKTQCRNTVQYLFHLYQLIDPPSKPKIKLAIRFP